MGSKILLFQKPGVRDMSIFRTKLKASANIHMYNCTPTYRCMHRYIHEHIHTHILTQ